MATIRKPGRKYHVQIRRKGERSLTKSFCNMKDAKDWARGTETKIDRNELGPDRRQLNEITLSELVKRYRDEVVVTKKSATVQTIVLNAFLRHSLCARSLATLTTADFAKYRDDRLNQIKPCTLQRQLAPVHNMFEIARNEWGVPLGGNPLDKLSFKAIAARRERRLQDGEYERLLSSARTRKNPYIEKVIIFAIETAMRRGEILSLCWGQVDLKRRCVTVLESKNGHSRTIPLTPKAYALMQSLRPEGSQLEAGNRVFPITPNTIKMAWGRMLKLADIDDLRFHDLRHEAVSRFFEMGLTVILPH